jgi:paraquat-inducible protein B
MLSKANPTVIGAFVIGGIILAICGLLVFGSGNLFTKTSNYVAFFPGAVDGLDVGAPVNFRGVRVGSVRDISLVVNTSGTMETYVKVRIGIEQSKAENIGNNMQSDEMYDKLRKNGLKAQLQMQSIVTGRLFVALDMFPSIPVVLRNLDKRNVELPVAPTDMEEL